MKQSIRTTVMAAFTVTALRLGAYDDLTILSDEFDASLSLANWQRIYQVEGWGNDALESIDINTARPGQMTMMPYTSSWYEEWRGELTFKSVTGDFVITTDVEPRNRAGNGAPGSPYSLAGIMVRTPRAMTNPAQWTSRGQNYVFLSLGAASNPGTYQFEVKTTVNSTSTLYISNGAPARASIQVARLGPHLVMLRREPGRSWQVHQRYYRPDMPATLQAGLTVYTDWPVCQSVGYHYQNRFVLTNGLRLPNGVIVAGCNPDLVAAFDYVRYTRPRVPENLVGANFSSAAAVTDAQLLSFLAESANLAGGAATAPALALAPFSGEAGFLITATVVPNRSYRVQRSSNLTDWIAFTNFISTGSTALVTDPGPFPEAPRFYRAISP